MRQTPKALKKKYRKERFSLGSSEGRQPSDTLI
jgi:hypothetical protein